MADNGVRVLVEAQNRVGLKVFQLKSALKHLGLPVDGCAATAHGAGAVPAFLLGLLSQDQRAQETTVPACPSLLRMTGRLVVFRTREELYSRLIEADQRLVVESIHFEASVTNSATPPSAADDQLARGTPGWPLEGRSPCLPGGSTDVDGHGSTTAAADSAPAEYTDRPPGPRHPLLSGDPVLQHTRPLAVQPQGCITEISGDPLPHA